MVWPFMALAGSSSIAIAEANGLVNVLAAEMVCAKIGLPFWLMCALLEKEGWPIEGKIGGHMIYGHDIGGVFRVEPPGYKYVTEANFAEFYQRVVIRGERSNGVGPLQITYRPYFPQMRDQGLRAWVPYDNMLFGGRLFLDYYRTSLRAGYSSDDAIRRSGTRYNTGQFGFVDYGDRLLVLTRKWRELLK